MYCTAERQGWEFDLLLKIALFKEWPWAIHSRRSLKKNHREQIVLVGLYKRATGRKSISSLYKKIREWFARDSFFCSKNTSHSLEKISIIHQVFYIFSLLFPFYAQLQIASVRRSLQKSDREGITPAAVYKRKSDRDRFASKSKSLFCVFVHKNEPLARKSNPAER